MKEKVYSRKMDSTGRIMIPIKLREMLDMKTGAEYYLEVMEKNGRRYLCIDCGPVDEMSVEQAMKVLQKNGVKIVQK